MSDSKELVLPSGCFARIRPLLYGDIVALAGIEKGREMITLIARLTTLDGKTQSIEEWLTMDADEVVPIATVIGDLLVAANKKGVA